MAATSAGTKETQTPLSASPAALPFIIQYNYTNFTQKGMERKAKCKLCGKFITEVGTTTSNFHRHFKTKHTERIPAYQSAKKGFQTDHQGNIDSFVASSRSGVQLYSQCNPRQKALTESIVQDLIISCNLPLSLVEHPHFRIFMSVADEKYTVISRNTATRRLSDLTTVKETNIKSKLQDADTVSVTVDIWTDRKMRGFLGVTAHFMNKENASTRLESLLLSCDRFKGSHTGERISEKFEEICDKFNIKHKLDYIVSDNASNMRKAFTVCFPSAAERGESGDEVDVDDEDDLDNGEFWEDGGEEVQAEMDVIQSSCRQQRLQCFAHSLQLVVRDGLKETKSINCAMAKVTKFCSLLHSTCGLKEAFEEQYGANRSIPAAVATRWNSTLRMVQSVTDLDPQGLNTMLEEQGQRNLCLSGRELTQLKELVEILSPFLQATDLTQGEKVVTLSAALPAILSLNAHLNTMLKKARHLLGLVKTLQRSLQHRFQGIFVNVKMDQETDKPAGELPFGDPVYMMSALLDPSYCLFWLENDVLAPDDVKCDVKEMVIDHVLAEASQVAVRENSSGEEKEVSPPQAKVPRLFSGYRKKTHKKNADQGLSVKSELKRYIQNAESIESDIDCLAFWNTHAKVYPRIYNVAMRVLGVPATSAPVERVFSHGGIIMRPHRARLSDTNLSNLIFLKCNRHVV